MKFRNVLPPLLIAAGAGIAYYLLDRTWALLREQVAGKLDACSALFGTGCDETLLSETSWFLNIPVAGWGLIYFVLLGTLWVLRATTGTTFRNAGTTAIIGVNLAGLVFSLYLSTLLILGETAFCPMCVVTHVINFVLFAALLWESDVPVREMGTTVRTGAGFALRNKSARVERGMWKTIAFAGVALAGLAVYQGIAIQTQSAKATASATASAPGQSSAPPSAPGMAFYDGNRVEIPIGPEDPRRGPADAPVELVVFSDFRCPSCRRFAQTSDQVLEHFGDQVSLVFKHFPLSTSCNPKLPRDVHPRACDAALAAIAAHEQNNFWPYHDAFFKTNQSGQEYVLQAITRAVGMNVAAWEAYRKSPEAQAKLAADIDLGWKVGVQATPSVFLNGRLLSRDGKTNIVTAIREALPAPAEPEG